MARAQDAQPVTGGRIDPYAQQSLMQDKQLANNRLVAAMQEGGATQRQSMAGKQQMQQQTLAGQQQMQQTAAQIAAEDRRAAEVERGRREDTAEQKRQFQETQQLTSRLADRQFAFEKAVDERDYEQAERLHKEMRAIQVVADRVSAEQARAAMKVMVSQFAFASKKELAQEKLLTSVTNMKSNADELKSAFEKDKPRFVENFLADKRFDLYADPRAKQRMSTIKESLEGTKLGTAMTERRASDIQAAIQRQAGGNGSSILLGDLTASGFGSLEAKVSSGKVNGKDIRMMYTTLEAAKDAIRSKLADASDRETREWNAELLRVDAYEATLDRLKSSTAKITGDDNRSVGTVARTGLGVVQGSGIPGIMDAISKSSATDEDLVKNIVSEMQKAIEIGVPLPYQEGDDEFVRKEIDERNIGRGLDISKPTIPISEEE
jgi:hypothetical protein